ncbi:hypothetical protein [Flavobacterium branchiophilum]|uniref:Lipoprotein n=1 Tax=Flavobacterium branchiophilum TaxID=55197 RepID=A0A2H3KT92_9FLAO|nr:hypothetical protein [Flavobacterium branchiophilum]PDS22981.1 hypothetical protein B0A77_11915 [Flavobacterium branchiophilum]
MKNYDTLYAKALVFITLIGLISCKDKENASVQPEDTLAKNNLSEQYIDGASETTLTTDTMVTEKVLLNLKQDQSELTIDSNDMQKNKIYKKKNKIANLKPIKDEVVKSSVEKKSTFAEAEKMVDKQPLKNTTAEKSIEKDVNINETEKKVPEEKETKKTKSRNGKYNNIIPNY